ncbi:RNA polymerase sigma factor [Ferruginibacter sp. SUN106]|uniref:RNA polymerase sigma factor n=1 Tax=Ferruginibacter sp. SUN106 TaxID=2978348 RepID=UPI003D35E8A8
MNNDDNLWLGLRQGDKEMFLALYKKYYHTLLFIGLKEMKDAQLVKDTIQQLFLYLWEKRETIQEANNVKCYLVTSFLRKLTSDWKKSKQSGVLQVVWNSYAEDSQLNPEEKLIRKDEQSHLFKLLMDRINELPNRQKELIVLKFYEGLSYEEIVQRTGLSHRTVYNKIHEGLKKLKLDMAASQYPRSAALLSLLTLLAAAATIAPAR